jgi:hypothetical protein
MFWLALAAQISAPAPKSIVSWFSADDVPEYLLQQGPGVWEVPVRVSVAPDGEIRGCQAETAGPATALDDHTCKIIRRRGKFRPAQIDGVPTDGVYRTSITYVIADTPRYSKVSNADIDVDLKRLPAGLKSPTLVKVVFKVDATGTKSLCAADGTEGLERVNNHPALVPIACDQVMKLYRANPATVSGTAVISVQNASVQFSAPPPRQKN